MTDTDRAAGGDTTYPTLVAALKRAGFEPDDNICGTCKHHGGRHDLNNVCLDCGDRFSGMTDAERWQHAAELFVDDPTMYWPIEAEATRPSGPADLATALAMALHGGGVYCSPTIGKGGTNIPSETMFKCSPAEHIQHAHDLAAHEALRPYAAPSLDAAWQRVEALEEALRGLRPYWYDWGDGGSGALVRCRGCDARSRGRIRQHDSAGCPVERAERALDASDPPEPTVESDR